MTTSRTLIAAKTKAGERSNEDLELALGNASNEFDRLLMRIFEDGNLSEKERVERLSAIAGRAGVLVDAASNGSQLSLPSGSNSTDTTGTSGHTTDELEAEVQRLEAKVAELEDKLERAGEANDNLKKDRTTLEKVVATLPTSVKVTSPPNTSTPFDDETPQRVKKAIEDEINAAKRTATPSDAVEKTEVDKIVGTMVLIDESDRTVRGGHVKAPLGATKANNKAIEDLKALVS